MDYFAAAFGKPQTVPSKEALTERNANRVGEFIELSSRGESFPGRSLCSQIHALSLTCGI